MTFDELYKKVIDAQRAFEERHIPIYLDFKIEDLRDVLVETKDTIEKLKQNLQDQCISCPVKMQEDDVVAEKDNEIRRLKRALWLARAELCRRLDVDRYLRKHINSWYNENCLTWAEACVAMEVKMCKAESKCRAKAEEYK